MELPKNFAEGKALYKEATRVEFTYRGDEPPRDAAFRLHQWCREYIDDNSRGNSVKTPPAN